MEGSRRGGSGGLCAPQEKSGFVLFRQQQPQAGGGTLQARGSALHNLRHGQGRRSAQQQATIARKREEEARPSAPHCRAKDDSGGGRGGGCAAEAQRESVQALAAMKKAERRESAEERSGDKRTTCKKRPALALLCVPSRRCPQAARATGRIFVRARWPFSFKGEVSMPGREALQQKEQGSRGQWRRTKQQ